MILSKVIKEHIIRNGENKIYTVSDFADLNNDMLVTRVLSRLKEEQFPYQAFTRHIPVSEQEQVWNLQAEH